MWEREFLSYIKNSLFFFEIKKKVERNNREELKLAVNIWIKYTLVFVESISSDFIISYI